MDSKGEKFLRLGINVRDGMTDAQDFEFFCTLMEEQIPEVPACDWENLFDAASQLLNDDIPYEEVWARLRRMWGTS